jgi:hypothetical protein
VNEFGVEFLLFIGGGGGGRRNGREKAWRSLSGRFGYK